MDRDVIIFGMGNSAALCPFDTETWVVNMGYTKAYKMGGRMDKLFTAHSPEAYPFLMGTMEQLTRGWNTMDWDLIDQFVNFGLEVISIHKINGVRSKIYPLKRIIKKFGTDYFTDSLCYMIAYAIDKNYTKIRLYGVDMLDRDEFKYEKEGIEYWIGYARGRGIEVTISDGSNLCKTVSGRPYGIRCKVDKGDFMERELRRLTKNSRMGQYLSLSSI